MFDEKKVLILTLNLDATIKIEVSSIGYGATTRDFTEIRKITSAKNELLKRIDGSYLGYKTSIVKVNDTLFKIVFTDTSVFKGMNRTFIFNLNKGMKQ